MRIHNLLILLLIMISPIISILAIEYIIMDIVGDSISIGVNPDYFNIPKHYGWVHMLFGEGGDPFPPPLPETIDSLWPGIIKKNSAVSGSKASDWVLQDSPLTRVIDRHPDLVIVMIGGNDFLYYMRDNDISSSEIEEYRRNLGTIIDRLNSNIPKPDIILVDYFDLMDGYSSNLPSCYIQYQSMTYAAKVGNAIIHDTAEQKGTYLVSIHDAFLHHAYGEAIGDTQHMLPEYFRMPLSSIDIHPNTAGYKVIHDLIYDKLYELKYGPVLKSKNWSLYE